MATTVLRFPVLVDGQGDPIAFAGAPERRPPSEPTLVLAFPISRAEIYTNTVIRLRHLDAFGRLIFVALDSRGRELDRRCVAEDDEDGIVAARSDLWDQVYDFSTRHLQKP